MTLCRIFHSDAYKSIEASITDMLNAQPDFLTERTAASTRAAGDAIQDILSERFQSLLGDLCVEYSPSFARRAMADLAFTDVDGNYHVVDVKTHRLDTSFNMPNLTSIRRLIRLYEDDSNYFVMLMVKYRLNRTRLIAESVNFVPIEFLAWDCLTIGALGWGQIQIANANRINIVDGYSRRAWMLDLCEAMLEFYPREIAKINDRMGYIERVRQAWRDRADIWTSQ